MTRIVYPIGCFWAKVVPTRVFNAFGVRWTLNTGPFTIKEHTVITVRIAFQNLFFWMSLTQFARLWQSKY